MNEPEKVNSAAFKAEFKKYVEQVRAGKRIDLQNNNKDLGVSLVPSKPIQLAEKANRRQPK